MSRRLRLAAVLPRGSLGDFSLQPTQVTSGLVVTSLAVAQSMLRAEAAANTLLCVSGDTARTSRHDRLTRQVARCLKPQLNDFGLSLAAVAATDKTPASLRLVSRRLMLDRPIDRAAARVLGPRGGRPSLVFLANLIRPVGSTASIPYSTIVGLDSTAHPAGDVVDDAGRPLPLPGPDEIIIDRWMADDLAAQGSPVAVGDTLEITTFLPETLHGRVGTPERARGIREEAPAKRRIDDRPGDHRLAGLGELVGPGRQQLAEAEHDPSPLGQGHLAPRLERIARGAHGVVHVGAGRERDVPGDPAGGGIEDLTRPRRGGVVATRVTMVVTARSHLQHFLKCIPRRSHTIRIV